MKVDTTQKMSLSKLFVDSRNSIVIVNGSILLFVETFYLDDPYNKIRTYSLSKW